MDNFDLQWSTETESEIIEYLSVILLRVSETLAEEQERNSAKGFDDNPEVDLTDEKEWCKDSKIDSYFSTIYDKSFNDYINTTIKTQAT